MITAKVKLQDYSFEVVETRCLVVTVSAISEAEARGICEEGDWDSEYKTGQEFEVHGRVANRVRA